MEQESRGVACRAAGVLPVRHKAGVGCVGAWGSGGVEGGSGRDRGGGDMW
jgi:hypothetical protein